MKEQDRTLVPQAAAPKWEYMLLALRTRDRSTHLNELGSEGWELVTVDHGEYVFKRPRFQENNAR